MGLTEELYCAMIEVGYFANKNKALILLAKTMIDIARHSLEDWFANGTSITRFATEMLAKDDLCYKSWELDGETCTALWKLLDLLEYISESF